jgi:hypothetical protein
MTTSPSVRELLEAIARGDAAEAQRLLDATPSLATEQLSQGATRQNAASYFVPALGCYLNEGDTPLHIAAAAWRADLLRDLIARGAQVMARNRLGATPLHHAANGNPQSARWDPGAQSEAIGVLIAAGADPNAPDNNGSTPLHKAIRTRCATATEALLSGGADPTLRTRNGSTPERLASVTSGRGGSGSLAAKAQQAQILELLQRQARGGLGPVAGR